MLKIIGQYNSHRGPTAMGEHKLLFDVPKEFGSQLYPVLAKLEKAPHVIMYLEVIETQEDIDEMVNETEADQWQRLNKKIHAMFDEIARIKKIKRSDVKKTIKDSLIEKKLIKTSLKDLSLEQQLNLIGDLQEMVIDLKFND